MAFYGWLQRQTLLGKVSAPVEQLALDIGGHPGFPRNSGDYGEIRERFARNGQFQNVIAPFRET